MSRNINNHSIEVREANEDFVALFSKCVSNPANISITDTKSLTFLSTQFPYCQLLHTFTSKSIPTNNLNSDQQLSKAALYAADRSMLYRIIHDPEKLVAIKIKDTNLIITQNDHSKKREKHAEMRTKDDISHASVIAFEEDEVEKHSLANQTPNNREVSKYDDDTMPFSFLWWLHKTRKSYSDTYQPYVKAQSDETPQIKANTSEKLDQQVVEHTVHQGAPLKNLEGEETQKLTFKREAEAVLDKFIQKDPHMKPPKLEHVSTDNKARTSAQDMNDLVSETLAEIYIKQELLNKAIEVYKKLHQRFPEKNMYFSELIQDLEKKINNKICTTL